MRRLVWFLLPLFIFLIFACQAPGGPEDFPEAEELEEEVREPGTNRVRSIEPGKFVSTEDTIPIDIDIAGLEQAPYELIINLLDMNGAVLATQKQIFEEELEKQTVPDLVLPVIPEGQYLLQYRFYNTEGELFYEETVSFFYITETYEIGGIRSFPNAINPSSTAILKANIIAPPDSNPYLRWKIGDEIISEGYYSENAHLFSWLSPELEGIYSVSLELFPVMPKDGLTFSSEIQMTTELYVTAEPEPERNELQPEDRYFSLFHFRGNTRDSGYRESKEKTSIIGSPELRLSGETYGYFLDGNSGFSVPSVLLPFENNRLLPFSLVFEGIFNSFEPGQSLFRTATADGLFTFRLGINDDGRLQAVFGNGTESAVSVIPGNSQVLFFDPDGGKGNITVSVVPGKEEPAGPEEMHILWYNGETLIHREFITIDLNPENLNGKSIIGGNGGFTGLLDEFGIYHNRENTGSSIIENVFAVSLEERFGLDLRFAEGFDSYNLPDNLSYTGGVRLSQGKAVLPGGGSEIELPPLMFRNENADIKVEVFGSLPAERGFVCRVEFPDTDLPPVMLDVLGNLSVGDEEIVPPPFISDGKLFEFALIHNRDGVILKIGDERIPLDETSRESVNVLFSIQNGTEQDVMVEGISIISTSEDIVRKETESIEADDSSLAANEDEESEKQEIIL